MRANGRTEAEEGGQHWHLGSYLVFGKAGGLFEAEKQSNSSESYGAEKKELEIDPPIPPVPEIEPLFLSETEFR